MKRPFHYRGRLPSSKSILGRLLLLRSHARKGAVTILGDSACEDVRHMKQALEALETGSLADCGEAGLVLRLLAVRASRKPGIHRLTGSARLLQRPMEPLFDLLGQLGVHAKMDGDSLLIEGTGWVIPEKPVQIDRKISSQFASAVLLNAWGLPSELRISVDPAGVSESYFEMSLHLATEAGMKWKRTEDLLAIPAAQHVASGKYEAEIDLSSAFAIAALAAAGGYAELQDYPVASLQPDREFPSILTQMGVDLTLHDRLLAVHKSDFLRPIEWNLENCPDLFPVLAVLCSIAEGTSRLYGAPHLAHKESNRVDSTARLLTLLDRKFEKQPDGMMIHGRSVTAIDRTRAVEIFDPDQDHRLVMAAAVASAAGFPVTVTSPDAVKKSFPEFLHIFRFSADQR